MTDSLVLLSGGIDSCVVLAQEVRSGRRPRWLAIDYGQRHRRELDSAQAIAAHYGLEHHGQVEEGAPSLDSHRGHPGMGS